MITEKDLNNTFKPLCSVYEECLNNLEFKKGDTIKITLYKENSDDEFIYMFITDIHCMSIDTDYIRIVLHGLKYHSDRKEIIDSPQYFSIDICITESRYRYPYDSYTIELIND